MKACAGIYIIKCVVNEKLYIGSSVNCRTRCKDHVRLLSKGTHGNKYLQAAWNKYGAKNFNFWVLEECPTEDSLLVREQFWIDKYRSAEIGFNCAYPVKGRVSSERMAAAHKAYWGSLTTEERKERLEHLGTGVFQEKATAGKRRPAHRARVSAIVKAQWAELPEFQIRKEELRERFESFKDNPAVLGKISVKAKKRWCDPEYRERGLKQIGEASQKAAEILLSDPVKHAARLELLASVREKAAEATRAKWADPEFRARRVAQMKLPRKRKKSE